MKKRATPMHAAILVSTQIAPKPKILSIVSPSVVNALLDGLVTKLERMTSVRRLTGLNHTAKDLQANLNQGNVKKTKHPMNVLLLLGIVLGVLIRILNLLGVMWQGD